METYSVTFVQEKQFFLGNPTVKVIVDDKMLCELIIKSGDSAKVEIPYGKHHITLTGCGKRIDSEIFVKESGTIQLRWNRTWGKPEIADIGNFDPIKNIAETVDVNDDAKVSVIYNGGGQDFIVIQKIREVAGVDLKEAKKMYSRIPCVVKSDISKREAAVIKTKFEQIGVSVIVDEDGSQITVSQDKNLPIDIAFGLTKAVNNYLWINENKKTAGVPKTNFIGAITGINAFKFEDILDFELIQDGSSIINKGGLGRAAVGGLLFGGSGAVVGTLTGSRKQTQTCIELRVKITINNAANPVVFIDFIKGTSIDKDTQMYRQLAECAEAVMSLLQVITNTKSTDQESFRQEQTPPVSNADEIRKFKALLDDGIITQEEFDAKKRQLLGL